LGKRFDYKGAEEFSAYFQDLDTEKAGGMAKPHEVFDDCPTEITGGLLNVLYRREGERFLRYSSGTPVRFSNVT
jgi:hypothetical protein